jgi:uncharacterized membrane protein
MLWILNFVSLFICFPKRLRIALFILLYVCNLSSNETKVWCQNIAYFSIDGLNTVFGLLFYFLYYVLCPPFFA